MLTRYPVAFGVAFHLIEELAGTFWSPLKGEIIVVHHTKGQLIITPVMSQPLLVITACLAVKPSQ